MSWLREVLDKAKAKEAAEAASAQPTPSVPDPPSALPTPNPPAAPPAPTLAAPPAAPPAPSLPVPPAAPPTPILPAPAAAPPATVEEELVSLTLAPPPPPPAAPSNPAPKTIPFYQQQLTNSSDPRVRLGAVRGLVPFAFSHGIQVAGDEILQTLMNDYSGEVVLATAFACAGTRDDHTATFRAWTIERFKVAGERSTSDGVPLLRLAYLAALERDAKTLESYGELRPRAFGFVRIRKLLEAVRAGDRDFALRLMAWSEGLDRQCDLTIFDGLSDMTSPKAWVTGLGGAIEFLKRNPDWHPESAQPTVTQTTATPTVRRDQFNKEFRTFYNAVNMSDGMLGECDLCGILLTRDGGGAAGGIGVLAAVQRQPAAVAAFIKLMSDLLGKDKLPNFESNPMAACLGLMNSLSLKTVNGNVRACPACAAKFA